MSTGGKKKKNYYPFVGTKAHIILNVPDPLGESNTRRKSQMYSIPF